MGDELGYVRELYFKEGMVHILIFLADEQHTSGNSINDID
jgi:hypothetical protein